ncbi:hypothetical protein STRAU_4606 [Streptomyces aurantiacus JA 4570]|uniref:Uncharacterized protein n=1 Tax=Streptomyces aurantiacus JA 4570 TaxID=1286094 RepID=S3ZF83_9ACTN|nr:hypothetical protein STRAU_4606 [Streptomyces aurantiacus JA 4570]
MSHGGDCPCGRPTSANGLPGGPSPPARWRRRPGGTRPA